MFIKFRLKNKAEFISLDKHIKKINETRGYPEMFRDTYSKEGAIVIATSENSEVRLCPKELTCEFLGPRGALLQYWELQKTFLLWAEVLTVKTSATTLPWWATWLDMAHKMGHISDYEVWHLHELYGGFNPSFKGEVYHISQVREVLLQELLSHHDRWCCRWKHYQYNEKLSAQEVHSNIRRKIKELGGQPALPEKLKEAEEIAQKRRKSAA